jgi:HEAT repeat protein
LEFSDTDIIDTVIEAFVQLNLDKQLPLDSVREVLADENEIWANRDAAAKAVGDLADLDSFELLKRLADDEDVVFNLRCRAIESLGKLGQHLLVAQPASPRLVAITTMLHELLENYEDEGQNMVRTALTGYGALGDGDDAEVLFPLLADRRFNVDAIVAELTILTRHPEDAYQVVREYLPWRTANGRLPNVPESPDRCLIGFNLYLKSTVPCDAAGRAVAAALARAETELQDEECRRHADQLLDDFLLVDAAPHIDPKADQPTREAQFQAWSKWWDGVEDQLQLKAGQLVAVSPAP